jgi:hypothetical protein
MESKKTLIFLGTKKMFSTFVRPLSTFGEMAEWSNAAVSKTVVLLTGNRGFESPSLRKAKAKHPDVFGMFFCFQADRSKLVLIRTG